VSTNGIIALATLSQDGLRLDDLSGFRGACRRMSQKHAGRVRVMVEPCGEKRTRNQNAYWWSVPVRILAEHCGYTDAQMHYALLGECFGYTEGLGGKPVPVKPSSSDLTVEEFKHLIDWVLTWAPAELGVIIPAPNEEAA